MMDSAAAEACFVRSEKDLEKVEGDVAVAFHESGVLDSDIEMDEM